jgi:serine/threonine protein kinase
MELDFENLTLNDWKNQALTEQAYHSPQIKQVISQGEDSSLEQINEAFQNSLQLEATPKLFLAMILMKATKSAPLPNSNGVHYFSFADYFCKKYQNEAQILLDFYSGAIILEISGCSSEILLKWAENLKDYWQRTELEACFKWLKCNMIRVLYSELRMLGEKFEANGFCRAMKIMEFSVNFKGEVEELVKVFVQGLFSQFCEIFIISSIETLSEEGKKAKKAEIMIYLKQFKRYVDSFTEEDKRKYQELSAYAYPDQKRPFEPETFSGKLDVNQIIYTSNNSIYEKDLKNGSFVRAYRATYMGKKVVVKYYSNCTPEILKGINNEVNILIYLANRLTPNCLFLNFYGSELNDNNCMIVIEDGGERDLMQYISFLRESNKTIPNTTLEIWIKVLIETFAWLNSVGIIHKDIKPHNIVIKESTPIPFLKIIDFSVSDQRAEPEYTLQFTGFNLIQGTKGYMAPELLEAVDRGDNKTYYKQGKADVFSLGLTILQLYTFKDYSGWNNIQFNRFLLAEVDNINSDPWVKLLLKKMLIADPKERASFKHCTSFFPALDTFQNY